MSDHGDDVLLASVAIIISSVLKVRKFWNNNFVSNQAFKQRRNTVQQI